MHLHDWAFGDVLRERGKLGEGCILLGWDFGG